MDTNPIKAVTFIKDEIRDTNDINSIFALPHEMKLNADYAKAKLLDDMKDYVSTPNRVIEDCDFYANQRFNAYNTVACFYSINALDLYRDSQFRFINTYLPEFAYNLVQFIIQPQGVLEIVKHVSLSDMNYMDRDDRESVQFVSGDPSDCSFQLAFLRFEQSSDSIIQLFTVTYINFINDIVKFLASSNETLDKSYNSLYNMVYGNDTSNHTNDFYQRVQFITCILREAAEQELVLIRNGLSMVSSNSTFMLSKQLATQMIGLHKNNKPVISAEEFKDCITDIELVEEDKSNDA